MLIRMKSVQLILIVFFHQTSSTDILDIRKNIFLCFSRCDPSPYKKKSY